VDDIGVEGLEHAPFVVTDPSGSTSPVTVRVRVQNVGSRRAGPSTVHVRIFDLAQTVDGYAKVRRLKTGPDGWQIVSVDFNDLRLRPGFAHVVVTADVHHKVKESDEHNNTSQGSRIAVEARRWNVAAFSTKTTNLSATDTTQADPGFYFRFSNFDSAANEFDYVAVGTARDIETQSGTCSYNVQDTATESPWVSSQLAIVGTLEQYRAFVPASQAAKYVGTVTCLGFFAMTRTFSFADLTTAGGSSAPFTAMTPTETDLSFSHISADLRTTWTWHFTADVPK
jgi:CARDB